MKKHVPRTAIVVVVGVVFFLLGAGNVSTYTGTVRSVKSDKLTILLKDGYEKNCKVDNRTRSFVTGKLLPITRIRSNSFVQVVIDEDVCLQVVVEEAPK